MNTSTRREFIVDNTVLAGTVAGFAAFGATFPIVNLAHAEDITFHESNCRAKQIDRPKVLVTYASRCGSTGGVAAAIGAVFCRQGVDVDVKLVKNVEDITGYQALVIGSAVRNSKWLPEAINFVKTHRESLRQIPVGYFLTCLAMCRPSEENRKTALSYMEPVRNTVPEIQPVDTGLFAGTLDYTKLSFMVGLIMKSKMNNKGIESGDYRNWNAIRVWAGDLYPKFALDLKKTAA